MKSMKLGLASVALVLGLTACPDVPGLGGDGPEISSFMASPESIQAGGSSTLSWTVDSTATSLTITPGVGDVTGETSVTVTPSTTTEYTLTAVGDEGSSEESTTVTVSGTETGGGSSEPIPEPLPGEGPDGAFGVSTTETGPFLSDVGGNITSNDDENIITVAPGDTFYAQVNYAAAEGATIEDVEIRLVNRTPEGLAGTLGDTPVGGFTLGDPTSDCTLGSATYTCVYPITVGSDVEDIEDLDGAGGEFAYVFRTVVTDSAGADNGISNRGYVNIE